MKHIKGYREAQLRSPKLFESSESTRDICRYLNDIFLELSDIGFSCEISVNSDKGWGKAGFYTKAHEDIIVSI